MMRLPSLIRYRRHFFSLTFNDSFADIARGAFSSPGPTLLEHDERWLFFFFFRPTAPALLSSPKAF